MTDFDITEHVFPTSNDLFGDEPAGAGINMHEVNLAANWIANLFQNNFVLSGLTVPSSSVDLNIIVAVGKSYIAGYFVKTNLRTITATASATNHVFLRLDLDGGNNVSAAILEVNTTGIAPARSVKIAELVTDADNITSASDERNLSPFPVELMRSAEKKDITHLRPISTNEAGTSGGDLGGIGGPFLSGSVGTKIFVASTDTESAYIEFSDNVPV